MKCLDTEQLVAFLLRDTACADPTAEDGHLSECSDCAARLKSLQEQLARVETAMAWFDRDHAAERGRLLAALADIKPAAAKAGVTQKLKEVISMPRTWIGGAAAAVLVLAGFFLWHGGGPASLLAQTAQALRGVRSYQCRAVLTVRLPDGKDAVQKKFKMYWAAPGSIRTDTYKGDKLIEIRLTPKDKPGLDIDHRYETFARLEPAKGAASPLTLMGKLGTYSGQGDRELEKKHIKGISAPGFEIAVTKIDPDAGEGTLRVWIDPKSKLPLRVEFSKEPGEMTFDEFEWNVPSDRWFTVEAPASYQDKTPTPPQVEEVTKHIVTGLKTFAKYCGGKYPQATRIYGDVTSEELNRNAGLPPRSPPKDFALQKVYGECLKAHAGFGWMNQLQRESREAVYHGKKVGPQDKGKALFRWKLNDGRFRVIFGDLRVEDVAEAKLKTLEAK